MQTQTGLKAGDRVGLDPSWPLTVIHPVPDSVGYVLLADIDGDYILKHIDDLPLLPALQYLNIYPPTNSTANQNWNFAGLWKTTRQEVDAMSEPNRIGVVTWDGSRLAVAE